MFQQQQARKVVIAGFFPADVTEDGDLRVSGNSPVSSGVLDTTLNVILGVGVMVERLSFNTVRVEFPITPWEQSSFVKLLKKIDKAA